MAPSRRRIRRGKKSNKRMSKRFSRKMKGGVPKDLALSLQKRKKCWTDSCRLNEDKDILNYIETNPKEAINYQILNAALTNSKYAPLKTKLESITKKLTNSKEAPNNIQVNDVTKIVEGQNENDKQNSLENIIKLLEARTIVLTGIASKEITANNIINNEDTQITNKIIEFSNKYISQQEKLESITQFLKYVCKNDNKKYSNVFTTLKDLYENVLTKFNNDNDKMIELPMYLNDFNCTDTTQIVTDTTQVLPEEVNSKLNNKPDESGIELTQTRPEIMVGGKRKQSKKSKKSKRRSKQSKRRK